MEDWAPVTEADLPELGALIRAIEAVDRPRERQSLSSLPEDLTAWRADPARDTRLVRDGHGVLIGYAWNHPQHSDTTLRRVLVTGGVHPDRRRSGLGHRLLRWQLEAGRAWDDQTRVSGHGPLRYVARVETHLDDRQRLGEEFGLQPSRRFAVLLQRFSGPPVAPEPVPGVAIVALTPDLHEGARLANNEAFDDHWGMQPLGPERWAEQLGSVICRPQWCLAAREQDSGEVVGFAINVAYEAGWPAQGFPAGETDRLGVRRAWRKRGVASALLRRSMQIFHAAGMAGAGLGVDLANPTGAYPLYQELGYQVIGGFVVQTRTEPLDAG